MLRLNRIRDAFWSRCFLLVILAGLLMINKAAADPAPRPPLPGFTIVMPLRGVSHNAVRDAVNSGATIPMWDYSITSPIDNQFYSGSMVGRSPFFHGARTISIPAFLVPLIIQMPDGGVFDPTQPDSNCLSGNTPLDLVQQSPVLTASSFTMGSQAIGEAQYVDAFQRANFWTNVSATGASYHTTLGPISTLSPVTVKIPSGRGATYNSPVDFGGGCGNLGVMDNATFDSILQNTVLPALAASGVGPTALPLFMTYDVVQGIPGDNPFANCCVLGYHSAFGSTVQTYSVFELDGNQLFSNMNPSSKTIDVSTLSHEVAEWLDDPLGDNPTPAWGHTGQVSGCQGNLEVGDPLSGVAMPPIAMTNGFNYDVQELAFYSWFYRQSPSIGVNGWYSDNGAFVSSAGALCQ